MGQPPYAQRVIPCDCGSRDAYWHGDAETPPGRVYCCDRCWQKLRAKRHHATKKFPDSYKVGKTYRFYMEHGRSELAVYLGKNAEGMHRFQLEGGQLWTGYTAPVADMALVSDR